MPQTRAGPDRLALGVSCLRGSSQRVSGGRDLLGRGEADSFIDEAEESDRGLSSSCRFHFVMAVQQEVRQDEVLLVVLALIQRGLENVEEGVGDGGRGFTGGGRILCDSVVVVP